jgi:hypothetical protein
MELILIGGIVGLIIGVSLTVLYFIFGRFFTIQARALDRNHQNAQLARQMENERPLPQTGRPDEIDSSQKPGVAAKAGN